MRIILVCLSLLVLQQLLHLTTKSLMAGSHSSIVHRLLEQVYKRKSFLEKFSYGALAVYRRNYLDVLNVLNQRSHLQLMSMWTELGLIL